MQSPTYNYSTATDPNYEFLPDLPQQYWPNRANPNNLTIAAFTIGLLVIGILASLSIPSPIVAGGVCVGFSTAAGLLYLAKGDLKMRTGRLILRILLTAGLIAGGTLSILGIMQIAHVGYLILGVTGGLVGLSLLSHHYNNKNYNDLNNEYYEKYPSIIIRVPSTQ